MDYIRLIWANFKRKRLRSWLTVIGILIGITAIISLVALGQGLENAISSQFNFLGPDIIQISTSSDPFGAGNVEPLKESYIDILQRVRGVKEAGGRILKPVQIEVEDGLGNTMSIGLPRGEGRKFAYDVLNFEIAKGRELDENSKWEVVVGNMLGDSNSVPTPVRIGDKLIIQDKEFDVVGIAKKKGSFLLDASLFINEQASQELFDIKDQYTHIAVRADENYDLKFVIENIEKALRKERNVKEENQDFTVQSAQATLDQINGVLGGIQVFVYFIAGISILVSGIGIANTMFTSVLERTKDIGIMKATGATNKMIFLLFLMESGFLGMVGGLIGVFLGSSLALGLAQIGKQVFSADLIQAHISLSLILGALFFSFLIGTISGIIPAMKAATKHPVEALNYAK